MKYTAATAKPFSWSYSKLKNFKTCAFRYKKIDVDKKYAEDFSGEHLKWGKEVHTAFEKRVRDNTPFPKGMEAFEDAVAGRLVGVPGLILVEQQMAIRQDLSACGWFDKDVWFRSIADYLRINGPVALAIDYKTGKILEDSEQLALMAECVFAHYPEVQAVRTEFWWLKDDAATKENFYRNKRAETWARVMPDVSILENAHSQNVFPQKPSGLCKKHCIVTECPFHGKGGR